MDTQFIGECICGAAAIAFVALYVYALHIYSKGDQP